MWPRICAAVLLIPHLCVQTLPPYMSAIHATVAAPRFLWNVDSSVCSEVCGMCV